MAILSRMYTHDNQLCFPISLTLDGSFIIQMYKIKEKMEKQQSKIIYTKTDEAPYLATFSFFQFSIQQRSMLIRFLLYSKYSNIS